MKARIRKLNDLSVIVLAILVLMSCNNTKDIRSKSIPELSVIELTPVNEQFYETYTSILKGKQDIDIRPQVSGFITKVEVDEGELVHKGQLLFEIDPVQYQEAVNEAKASVEVAKANVATAELTMKNKKELGERKIISAYEIQLAQNEWESAKAQLALAEAQLISAQKNLSYTRITSPSDGIIGKIPYRIGSLVSSSMSNAMTSVTEFSTMYAYFSLTEKKLLALSKHSSIRDITSSLPKVKLQLSDGDFYERDGTIETISGTIDSSTGAASVRAAFKNEDGLLRSGGTGAILLPYTLENCLLIPQGASFEIQNKKFVFTVNEQSQVASTEIEIYPLNNGSDYVVTKGLKAGDKIVIEGVNALQSGVTIKEKVNTEYYAAR